MKSIGVIVLFLAAVLSILVLRAHVYDHLEVSARPAGTHDWEAGTEDILQLHFHERRPYYAKHNDQVYGLVAGPVDRLLTQASIDFEWIETPAGRQLDIVRDGVSPVCAVGWFKTPQRQRYAKYTLPVYQDGKVVAVTRNDNDNIKEDDLLERVFSDGRLKLLVKSGYSYGPYITRKMEEFRPWKLSTTADNVGMLEMIHDLRADYCFMSEEEAYELLVYSSLDRSAFKIIYFRDVPGGSKRYLLCSRKVDDAMMKKINGAIAHYIDIPADN